MAFALCPFGSDTTALRRSVCHILLAGAGIAATANAAQAQASFADNCSTIAANDAPLLQPAAGSISYTKSAAILDGAPSKLELIRMAQAGLPVPVQPAASPCIAVQPLPQIVTAPIVASYLPTDSIFGSVPVAVGSTPFDRQWAMAIGKRSKRSYKALLGTVGVDTKDSVEAQLSAVNKWVNTTITYREDRDLYGRADYWASARETLRQGAGDCEDFAIMKLELLAAAGIRRDQMRLVVARDLVRNADHAVLVVETDMGAFVLDNSTDQLLDARLPNDYRPIMSFSQNGKWVHGYAEQPSPVTIAVIDVAAAPVSENVAALPETPVAETVTVAVTESSAAETLDTADIEPISAPAATETP